jgi:hypothetical protein
MNGVPPDREMLLDSAAFRFAEAVHKCDPSAQFGAAASAEIDQVRAALPISDELTYWYLRAGPRSIIYIPKLGNDRKVYPSSALVDRQNGYRWVRSADGQVKPLDSWMSDWVVIGDVGGDPLIADMSRPGTPILKDVHGRGDWNPYLLAPTLASYLQAESIWINSCLVETGAILPTEFGVDVDTALVWDEEGALLQALSQTLERALQAVLPPQCIPAWLE